MPTSTLTRLSSLTCAWLLIGTALVSAQPISLPAQLLTPPGGRSMSFGTSVAISGTTLVVGDPGDQQRGAAFVYEWRQDVWTLVTRLTAADALPGDAFGAAVAIDDTTIVVGAPGDDVTRDAAGGITQTVSNKGAAYVFRRTADGWTQQARLDRSTVNGVGANPILPVEEDRFGATVAVDGDVVMVGAPEWDEPFFRALDSGGVFVYERAEARWTFANVVVTRAFGRATSFMRLGTTLAGADGVFVAGGGEAGGGNAVRLVRGTPPVPWQAIASLPTWFDERFGPVDDSGLRASFGEIVSLLSQGSGVLITEIASQRLVTATGEVSTLGPLPAATSRVFETPTTFVSAVGGKQVFTGDLAGTFTFLAGNPTLGLMDGTGTTAGFGIIGAIAPDGQGNYYVADLGAIRKVSDAGVVTTVAGLPGVVGAEDGPPGVGRLGTAQSLVFDPASQTLYIADRSALRAMAPDGTLSTIAGNAVVSGTTDGLGTQARFTAPGSLTRAPDGTLVMVDGLTIRRVTTTGQVSTIAGQSGTAIIVDGAGGVARFGRPTTLTVAPDGTLFVADASLVRRVDLDGTVTTLAGTLRAAPGNVGATMNRVALGAGSAAVALPDGDAPLRPAGEDAGVIWVSSTSDATASALPAYPPTGARAFGMAVAFVGDLLFASSEGVIGGAPITALRRSGDRWRPIVQFVPEGGSVTGFGRILAGSDRFLAAATTGTSLASTGVVFVFDLDRLDLDDDGLPDLWEERYGLDPTVSTGADGADGDPDGDGVTNASELVAHTHPRGDPGATRYFAEGARSDFFATTFSIANPATTAAEVLLRYASGDGSLASTPVTVPGRQSRTISVPLSDVREFATRVESDRPVVVDRLMSWDTDTSYGSHGERALAAPSTTWYFAEGATHSGFALFYLLYNPSATTASVTVRYLRGTGAPLDKIYEVAPGQRFNIWVNLETFAGQALLAAADVSARITVDNGVPIIAERAMYRTTPGVPSETPGALFTAGHESAGIAAPASAWFFAEGATNEFFDMFVLLANPADAVSTVRARFLLGDGRVFTKDYVLQPNSRFNIWVDQETFDGVPGTPLASVGEVSATIEVIDGPAIVAERAMWWPGPTAATWVEAHNSPGATTTATRWVAAAGHVDVGIDTYYLLANPGDTTAAVTVTLLFGDGTPAAARTYTVAPRSRFTVHVRSEFPMAAGRHFSADVTTEPSTPIVVEWAIYRDALGQQWGAGANALATPWP